MIDDLLYCLKEIIAIPNSDMVEVRNLIREYGDICYRQGFEDREAELRYFSGFSYGRKDDIDETYL